MHLETGGKYERKIEKLYHKKNQKHIDLEIDKNSDLEDNILQICMNNEYITSFEMVEDDECPIKGTIKELDSNKVIVSKLTEDGEEDGEAVLKKENIDTISFLGVDEEDIEILRGVNRSFKLKKKIDMLNNYWNQVQSLIPIQFKKEKTNYYES